MIKMPSELKFTLYRQGSFLFGRYFVESVSNRDYTSIMGVTLLYAAFVIMVFIDRNKTISSIS